MSTQTTEPTPSAETSDRDETTPETRQKRLLVTALERAGDGTLPALAGGALIANAVRIARRKRVRAGLYAFVGGTLLGLGVRRRRSSSESPETGDETRDPSAVSAEAHSHRFASDATTQTNPRGVAEESDVETDDGGDITYTTDQSPDESDPRPHLDGDEPEDPRLNDDGDHVDVSLSETDMTDELGKVAGPEDEQAFPASEGTDPEPTSPEAPERYGEGAVANKGTVSEEGEASDADEESEMSEENEASEDDDPGEDREAGGSGDQDANDEAEESEASDEEDESDDER